MRLNSTVFALTFFCSGVAFAETPPAEVKAPTTKLESALLKKGQLLIKEFTPLGTLEGAYGSSVKFDALVLTQPGLASEKGLRIEVNTGGQYDRTETSFLDQDEITGLAKSIDYMSSLAEKWKGTEKEYTEVVFSTKGDFSLGFYLDKGKFQVFCSSGYVGKVTSYLPITMLSQIKEIASQATLTLALTEKPRP